MTLEQIERQAILHALRSTGGNRRQAASMLGISVRTLQRWRAAYGTGGLEALEPKSRKRTQSSVVLSEALLAFLKSQKERDPRASVPELIRRAQARGILPADTKGVLQ